MPILLATAKSSPAGTVRVINTASLAHMFVDGINYDVIKDPTNPLRSKLGHLKLYGQSKLVRHSFVIIFRDDSCSRRPCRQTSCTRMSCTSATRTKASCASRYIQEISSRRWDGTAHGSSRCPT